MVAVPRVLTIQDMRLYRTLCPYRYDSYHQCHALPGGSFSNSGTKQSLRVSTLNS